MKKIKFFSFMIYHVLFILEVLLIYSFYGMFRYPKFVVGITSQNLSES